MSIYTFTNFSKTHKEMLVDMINLLHGGWHGAPFTAAESVFNDPVAVGYAAANTKILFGTNDPAKNGAGPVDILYDRIDLGKEIGSITVTNTTMTKKSDIIPTINSNFGYNMTVDDVRDKTISITTTPFEFNLVCVPWSAIYTGSLKVIVDPT